MSKLLLFTIFFFIITSCATAQSHIENFTICGRTFTIKCEAQIDNSIRVSVADGINKDSIRVVYEIRTNDMEIFAKFFQINFSDSMRVADTACVRSEKDKLLTYGRELLRRYETSLQNTVPKAGTFKLQDSVGLEKYFIQPNGKIDTSVSVDKYKVARLQAEINDGYLENIVLSLTSKGKVKTFTLPFPLGMSSVSNFKKYFFRKLYQLNSSPFVISNDPANPDFLIKLSDVIDYDYYLGIKRRDYSPKDTIIDIQGGTSLTLHKEETKKLFEAHIFTDFQGLNENNPNGLIQTEISKRVNTNTIQYLSKRWMYWFFGSYGYLQYVAPSVSLLKLEKHNKRITLLDLDSVRIKPGETDTSKFNRNYHRYANALDLYQYQWFSAGTDFNLFYINNHELKYNIYLNVGTRLGFTEITDSLTSFTSSLIIKTGFVKQYSVTTFQVYPEVRINFLPEERFNFSLSQKWIYFTALSPTVQLVSYDKNNFLKLFPKSHTWLNTSELLMTIQVNPNTNGKVFGRIRFNWEASNIRNNFSQIQIGYSTYILGNK